LRREEKIRYLCSEKTELPMYTIIVLMFLGILAGRWTRRQPLQGVSRLVTPLVWLLLFLLGLEAGGNDQVVRSLPTLGLEALALALGATAGCLVLALWLWRRIGRTGERKGGLR
jgi:uncharacterized membrane protein YbjE (DUF340 family)